MSLVDPHFERIARRLRTLTLCAPDAEDGSLEERPGSPFGRVSPRLVGQYTASGLRAAIGEYGLAKKLEDKGLGDFQVVISEEDAFRQRLEVLLPEGSAPDRHLMDLRLHLRSVTLPPPSGAPPAAAPAPLAVVVVEWLLMQNPRARFTKERPRLPGQEYPGTGLGGAVAQLLVLMCRRIGRDGLIVVPARFHLAELYTRAGWLAPGPSADRDFEDVLAAARKLTFPARAWATERGFVIDEDGAPFVYHPEERALPVSDRMAKALAPGGLLWLARLLEPRRSFAVDVDGLARSLRTDPVEGMDPGALVQ